MLKKLKSKAGMTLMEVMVSLLIMVLLVVGMGTGMDAGLRVYADAQFASHSSTLSGYINTALTDVLRYAQDIEEPTPGKTKFNNLDYGLRNAYIEVVDGIIRIKGDNVDSALVNTGAYVGLKIKADSFKLQAVPDSRGVYFLAEYVIQSADGSKEREKTETVVRLMNG